MEPPEGFAYGGKRRTARPKEHNSQQRPDKNDSGDRKTITQRSSYTSATAAANTTASAVEKSTAAATIPRTSLMVTLNPNLAASNELVEVQWFECANGIASLWFSTSSDIRRFAHWSAIRSEALTNPATTEVSLEISSNQSIRDVGNNDSPTFVKSGIAVKNKDGVRLEDVARKAVEALEDLPGAHWAQAMTWKIEFAAEVKVVDRDGGAIPRHVYA